MLADAAPCAPPKLRYDLVEVVLFDPVVTNRSATRGALSGLGFRRIKTAFELQDAADRIKTQSVDLVIFEMWPDPEPVLALMHDIRQGRLGANPFAVIIATAWTLEGEVVKGVVQAGADDLMGRPFSNGFLGARIKQLVAGRKEFSITADYVGPDRRKDPPRDGSSRLFPVPNSLNLKSQNPANAAIIDAEVAVSVAEACALINVEKSRRNAFQILVLARLISEGITSAVQGDKLLAELQKVETLANEIIRRTDGTEFSTSYQICEPILEAVEAAKRGEDLTMHNTVVGHLASTLYVTLSPGKTAEETDAELTQALNAMRSRARRD
jgi:DNA-binding response OmpR family regulator